MIFRKKIQEYFFIDFIEMNNFCLKHFLVNPLLNILQLFKQLIFNKNWFLTFLYKACKVETDTVMLQFSLRFHLSNLQTFRRRFFFKHSGMPVYVFDIVISKAVEEEKRLNVENGNKANELSCVWRRLVGKKGLYFSHWYSLSYRQIKWQSFGCYCEIKFL